MPKARIQLTQAAADKRNEAQAKLEELKDLVVAQRDAPEGETRLTADELAGKRSAIEKLFTEAKEIENLDSLDGLMGQPEKASPAARRIIESDTAVEQEAAPLFKNMIDFMRAIRTVHGAYDNSVDLSKDQRAYLNALRTGAQALERGERLPEKEFAKDAEELAVLRKTLVGDDTSSTGRGDYLTPRVHSAELLRVMAEQQQFVGRARQIPMARRVIDFPRLSQTDATKNRPLFSFASVSKIAEGAEKPEREPVFEQMVLTAIKYAAYTEASDELLVDSIVDLPPVLVSLLTGAIGYEYDRDCIRGSGVGEPQGFLDSDAAYAVPRQVDGQISVTDVFNMEARLFGDNAIYLYSPSVIPQLYALTRDNVIVWNANIANGVPGTLLGRPLVPTHKLPTLGNKGDLCLVDPLFYLAGNLQRVTVANSIHYKFRDDVTAWRATFRAAGAPWPAGTFSHEAVGGVKTYEMSPFVVLDEPSSAS